ncbi:MAG: hypothetical protein AAGF98_17690 [Cyanobacteria bacterium P01_H01_bin.153]
MPKLNDAKRNDSRKPFATGQPHKVVVVLIRQIRVASTCSALADLILGKLVARETGLFDWAGAGPQLT